MQSRGFRPLGPLAARVHRAHDFFAQRTTLGKSGIYFGEQRRQLLHGEWCEKRGLGVFGHVWREDARNDGGVLLS